MRRRALFERLGGVLEAKKSRDAAQLGLVQAEIATLDAERDRLQQELATLGVAEGGGVGDMIALERWRAATRERIQDLAFARAELEQIAADRRQTLARSNGEREGARRLVKMLDAKR